MNGRRGIICRLILVILITGAFIPALLAFRTHAGHTVDATGRGSGYSAVLYDNSNGLPTSEANDIVQSEDGFIWIGGYSGLMRYDGNEFYRYDPSYGISSVVCLFLDSKQRLWIGTNDSGAAVMQYDEFTFYGRNDGLPSASVRSITEDDNNNIIIATTTGLAYVKSDGETGVFNDALIRNEYVRELYKGDDGVIYGITLSGCFFTVYDMKITGFYNSAELGFETVKTVYPSPDGSGDLYLGTDDRYIYRGSPENGMTDAVKISVEPLETVNAIRYINGALWVCSDSGIGLLDENMELIALKDLPMTSSIDHVMRDYEGNLWFSSSRQGVMKIVDNRFFDISARASLENLVVNSTCLDKGLLYIGTDNGLYILDGEYKKTENGLTSALLGVRIRCIRKSSDGYIWFCTYSNNGLLRYEPSSGEIKCFTADDGMASNRVRMVLELSDGSIAAATNAGLNVIKNGEVAGSYGSNIGIGNLEILCAEEGKNGKLYLGSDGGGIYVSDGGKTTHIGIDNGLKSEVILRIVSDPYEDVLWVITSNSISYVKDGEATTLHSFPYANNFDMFFDKNDRAWILCSNGIYVVGRDALLSDNVFEYTLFNKDHGLPGIATANSYSYITEEGVLYVSASTGVYSVNINEETGGGGSVKLSVPYVEVDGRTVWTAGKDTVHIPSGSRRISIYANAFTYSLNNPHLVYRLEGFDSDERRLTKQELTPASYTNLKGGTYRFVISIVNDITGETEQTAALTIIKEKAVYEQLWFNILIGLISAAAIAGLIVLIVKLQTAKLSRKQEENRKLIDEMTRVFSGCIDMKDSYTNGHSARVAKYTAMIAQRMGKTPAEVDDIYNIALLHDIGKIGIPDSILNKPGRLDDEEYTVMKSHAKRGYDILKDITIAPQLALGAGYHHEKYDGTGYPSGLKGEEIPEIARIIAVADAFDAMHSTRPYREKMPLPDAAAEIKRCSGTQFAPEIVDVFLKLVDEGAFTDGNAV